MKLDCPTGLFIDGQWIETPERLEVINPATGESLGRISVAGRTEVDAAVRAARRAFDSGPWPRLDPLERTRVLYRIAEACRAAAGELAMADTLDIGKPIRDNAGFDVPAGIELFETYAGLTDKITGRSWPLFPESVTFQLREPVGVIGAIVPWNFPFLNAAIKIAPALACGNCVVFKPSELAPHSAMMLARIAERAGLPAGALNIVNGTGAVTGQAMLDHDGLDKIAFTGRLQTGRRIMESCQRRFRRFSLELGGKTPSVVFPDAALECVADHALTGIFCHLGQVCVAGSRLLVHESIHDELLERIVSMTKRLRQGDPADPSNHLGCLATASLLPTIQSYVDGAVAQGAKLVIGGKQPDDQALAGRPYYSPTILDGVTPDMTVAREEVFGPVLAVMTFRDEDEAAAIANDTDFGLMANIWSTDGCRAMRLARRIRAGKIAINGGGGFRASAPLAGLKMSGFGADMGLDEAVAEYTVLKTVQFSLSGAKTCWPE